MSNQPSRNDLLDRISLLEQTIAELQQAAAHRQTEHCCCKLVETAHDAILVADVATGEILQANNQAVRLLGRPLSEIIGMHQTELHPPAQTERYQRLFQRAVEQGAETTEQLELCSKDGHRTPVEISANVTELGGRTVMQGIFRDISKRREMEQALRLSEQRFTAIANTTNDMIHLNDLEGRIMYANPATERLLGYPLETMLNRQAGEFIHPDDQAIIGQDMAAILHGTETPQPREIRLLRQDGTCLPVEVSGFRINFEGTGLYIGAILRDITERKQAAQEREYLELQAITQARLAALGRIATGIAHEINQPLSFLKVFCQSTLLELQEDALELPGLAVDCREALRQTDRISKITDHLRTFSRVDTPGFHDVFLPDVLDNSLILLGEKLRLAGIMVERLIEPDLPMVAGHEIKLEQVLINLLQNGADALEKSEAGVIRISMGQHENMVRLQLADNGVGMSAAVTSQIFEPFFTTKDAGHGTGLGLSIVHGIIQEHNGRISCSSAPGQGTVFTIDLPRS